MLELTWPIVVWTSGVIFFAGGAWFELHRLRKDFGDIKVTIAKVPVLEVKIEKCESDIRILQGVAND